MDEKIKAFINKLEVEGKSKNTIESYLSTLDLMRQFGKGKNIQWHARNLVNFLGFLRKRNVTNNTIIRHYSCVKSFFKYHRMPIEEFSIKKSSYIRERLSTKDVISLLRSSDDRTKILILILSSIGLRISEAINLRPCDLRKTSFIIKGKGDKSRVVYYPKKLKKKFDAIISRLGIEESSRLFNYTTTHNQRIIRNLGKRVLGKRVTPHSFRHYFATNMINNKMDIYVLSKLLGHSSIATTQIYAALNQDRIAEEFYRINGGK